MLGSYLVAKIIDKVFKNTNFTVTTPYISLHTTPGPGNNGANELTAGSEGGAYARQACASWDSATPRTNVSVLTWTNTPFAAATHFGIWDAASGGNYLMGGALSIPVTLFLGETARFSAGRLKVNCEGGASDYLKPKILDKVLKNTDFTVTAAYLSVHTGDPGGTGASEQGGSGTRPLIDAGTWTFNSPTFSSPTWTVQVDINVADASWTNMPNSTYTYIGAWDANLAGNFLWGGAVSSPLTTTGGNSIIQILQSESVFFTMTQN